MYQVNNTLRSQELSEALHKHHYKHLTTDFHNPTGSLWMYMQAEPRPCFTERLLNDFKHLFNMIENYTDEARPIEYVIAASGVDGVYNIGGDLETFIRLIRAGEREKLRRYAYDCLELGYTCYQQFNKGITSIALIEGDCFGGGFEAALSCNVLIATESARINFPEISFNLFPGMGAYSYLTRRVAPNIAEAMITSGRIYTGAELYKLGVIDICAPDGLGTQTALEFMQQHRRQKRGRSAMHKARQVVQPITLDELKQVSDIWVEAALLQDERSLKIMERFARAQLNKHYTKRSTEHWESDQKVAG